MSRDSGPQADAPAEGAEPGDADDDGVGNEAAVAVAPEPPDRTSAVFGALAALVLAVAVSGGPDAGRRDLVAVAGVLSIMAMLLASARLRARRTSSVTGSQRDPFLAFAAALTVLVAPHVLSLLNADSVTTLLDRHGWVTAVGSSALAAVGFAIMIRDLTPGRTADATFLAAIGAMVVGLGGWALLLRLVEVEALRDPPSLGELGPPVLDLFVLGMGLQALHLRGRARRATWLLVLAWTLVLVVDATALLAWTVGGHPAARAVLVGTLVACGLFGAAALHPDATHAAEPIVGPLTRLPRSQVALLAVAVLLGPSLLALRLHQPGSEPIVVGTTAAISGLVVAYLVRLVQGRAVLEHRAHHDALTGLANRTLFDDRAAVAIAHARRTGGSCAALFLDLDRFKNVNDSLGHGVGNLLLQAVAKRLRGATRAEDTVARLGGDEFVVFLGQLDDPSEATTVAANILESFEEPFALNGHRLFASPSIGIAVFPNDGSDAHALLENADIAMYRAKQQGRRTFCTYDRSMNDNAHERLALENQLHTAVDRGELRLHYQPKIHLPTGRVMGMEALLRWEHPEHGLLHPASFISLAEESGLIVPVGEWALEEACRQTQAWTREGFKPLVVAVNLSLRQFQQQRIGDVTARVLRATGLDPNLLELEVTESLAMQDPADIRATLLDLRALGVSCSIDDFGTGYSGLSHLAGFPIDKLKIDKSFVATIDADREAPIVVAVVALAHGLGLQVVAEGVETAEQLERLRELGCDEMQGFLFSEPLPPERFEQLLMLESISPGPGRLVGLPSRPRLIRAVG